MNSIVIPQCSLIVRCCSCVSALVVFLFAVFSLSAADRDPPAEKLRPANLNLGFTQLSFRSVNRNDAETAIEVCFVTIGRNRGYDIEATSEVFDTVPAFEKAIRSGELHIQIIPTWDYLQMDIEGFSEPHFVAVDDGNIMEENVLLARQEEGLTMLADLRGKSVVVLESPTATSSKPWIETVLLNKGLGRPEDFFGRVEIVHKVSRAVLPVFFGKYQACVVDRSAFQIMNELNPQIGRRLQILSASEPLMGTVFCLQKTGWESEQEKREMVDSLTNLHTEPAGQQLLTLFKVRKLVPFKPEYLNSMKRLKAMHDRLTEDALNRTSAFVRPFTGMNAP